MDLPYVAQPLALHSYKYVNARLYLSQQLLLSFYIAKIMLCLMHAWLDIVLCAHGSYQQSAIAIFWFI